MKVRTMDEQHEGNRSFVLVFDTGDEVMESLIAFARMNGVKAGHFTAIGALQDVVLAWFDPAAKDYKHIPINEQVEIGSLVGNISVYEGEPKIHAHLSVSKHDGTAMAGHLIQAHVRPTLELFVTELPEALERKKDEASGLPLINL